MDTISASKVAKPKASPQAASQAQRHSLRIMAVLASLMALNSISTDMYLPAMPQMKHDMGARSGELEYTVSGYLIGFSLGQLMWGAVSDRVGRRLPVAIGLVLFIIGSAGCALSGTAAEVIGWRVVQAVGACAGVVLARAMVRDLFERDRAAQMLSTLITIMAIAPLIGPFVGGQVLDVASWPWTFWLMVVIGGGLLVALFSIPETLPPERRDIHAVRQALGRYGELLRDSRILGFTGIGGFFYVGVYAYMAGSPFAYISYYHVPAQLYGLLFGSVILGIMAINTLNARLVPRFGSDRLLRWGATLAAVAGVAAAVAGWTGWGGLAALALSMLLFCGLNGLIVANSLAGALAAWPERAGAASALVGAMQAGSGIIGSALVGRLADGTPWPLGLMMGLAGIGSFACTCLLPKQSGDGLAASERNLVRRNDKANS